MSSRTTSPRHDERGATLAELMIAMVILSIGILAVARMFPAGSANQVRSRSMSTANYFMQEKVEELSGLDWADAALTAGRHPAGVAFDTLGTSGAWLRYYEVTAMAAPLQNLKQVTVTVNGKYLGARSVSSTTYLRR